MTSDRDLQERVLKALDFEPAVDATRIGVTTHNGIVTLRGSVPTLHEKWMAERVTSRVVGTRGLANDLDVLPDGAAHRTDSAIAEAAANAVAWDTAVPAKAVQVSVKEGWVTLTGNVEWRYQRDAAESAVRRLYGVKGLTNAIVLKPRVHVADVRTRIEDALKRSAQIDAQHIRVDAADGAVVLSGTVHSLAERRVAEQAAWSAPGVKMVDDRLAVAP